MFHNIELQEGAILISDAHYAPSRPELIKLVEDIALKKIETSQLLFFGDIFDTLFGSIRHTYTNNQSLIDLINTISQSIEVIYLEGNHDFNLTKVFPYVLVVPITEQPFACKYKDKKIFLAHGDFDGSLGYKMYTLFVRNYLVLYILRVIDNLTQHSILNFINKHLDKKNDCKEFIGFEKFIKSRSLEKYKCDYFIEGHFHQNRKLSFETFEYINLAAFACNQRYFIVESMKDKELLKEEKLLKGDS